ncbi:MAG: hypothetical protein HEQ39_08580 [Rhizobacter sp.]
MTSPTPKYMAEATRMVEEQIRRLQKLNFEQACTLPKIDGLDLVIAETKTSITTLQYSDAYQLEGKILVVVLAATPSFFGMTAFHTERGLFFSTDEPTRSATEVELENSGG